MTRIVLIAVVASAAAAACSRNVGYVDLNRAFNESTEGKRGAAELLAMADARKKEKAAETEAAKLGPVQKPIATDEEWQAAYQRRADEIAKPAGERLRRILPAIASSRKLAAISGGALYADPALDVTDELLRRFEAGEGREDKAAELTAAKAKVAALERQLQEQTKGK
jgi:Skp family chaperone for outer membrane proteins